MKPLDESSITYEPVKGGIGAGGQHAQKNATGIRATYLPTGHVVVIRGRSQQDSKRKALKALTRLVHSATLALKAQKKKTRRDYAIHNEETIRTYHYVRGIVKDHRTGRKAPLKQVLNGHLELLKDVE